MPLKLRLPLLIFLELLLMGTSETYIPLVLLFSGIFLAYAFFNKNAFLGPALVNLILAAVITGILVSFSGNQNRLDAQSTFNIKHGIFNYLHSLPLWTWRFLPALPLLAWIISVYRKDPGQRPAADVPVGLVPVALAGYFIMFTPLIFINLSLYKRLGNVFYFYFLIVAVATCMKLPRWFDLAAKTPKLIVFLLFLIFVSTGNIKLAYNDILHGYTKNYSQSLMSRFRYLEDHRGSSKVILPEIPKTDYVLSIQDVNSQDDILVIGLYNPLQLYYSIDTITTD